MTIAPAFWVLFVSMGTFKYQSLDEIQAAAQWLISHGQKVPVWLFEGEMGAGKTTLIKAICKKMQVQNTVQSPTFSIVNEYFTANGETIYHFDCYRLKNETEAMDIGIEEYFDSGNYCFVEWPSKIPNLLPDQYLIVSIEILGETERQIKCKVG